MGENADTVKARWDDFGKGDVDGAVSTTDENAEMIQKFLSNFESVDPKPTGFFDADDGETVFVTVEGTGKTKSGNDLSGRSVWMYKVSDGKLMSAEFFGDTAQARYALS